MLTTLLLSSQPPQLRSDNAHQGTNQQSILWGVSTGTSPPECRRSLFLRETITKGSKSKPFRNVGLIRARDRHRSEPSQNTVHVDPR